MIIPWFHCLFMQTLGIQDFHLLYFISRELVRSWSSGSHILLQRGLKDLRQGAGNSRHLGIREFTAHWGIKGLHANRAHPCVLPPHCKQSLCDKLLLCCGHNPGVNAVSPPPSGLLHPSVHDPAFQIPQYTHLQEAYPPQAFRASARAHERQDTMLTLLSKPPPLFQDSA